MMLYENVLKEIRYVNDNSKNTNFHFGIVLTLLLKFEYTKSDTTNFTHFMNHVT